MVLRYTAGCQLRYCSKTQIFATFYGQPTFRLAATAETRGAEPIRRGDSSMVCRPDVSSSTICISVRTALCSLPVEIARVGLTDK